MKALAFAIALLCVALTQNALGQTQAPVVPGSWDANLKWTPYSATNPESITGSVTTTPAATNYAAPATGTLTTSASVLATPGTKANIFCNHTVATGGTLWLNLNGGTAVVGAGLPVAPADDCKVTTGLSNAVTAVCSTGICTYSTQAGN